MAGKAKVGRKKKANTYQLPEPIPNGEILTDTTKKQWIIGTSIGVGGFGEIYKAGLYNGKPPKEYPNVIKIEPHGNGPLFVEMHFYLRNAKPDEIDSWRKKKKLPALGMPRYIGSGSHECNGTKYRFVVMDRYGTDLWKLFEENSRRFSEHTVYKIALQIINVLEYIHHKTYVHADIKGGNLLLDLKLQDQVYLVDFGLASHYTTKPEYKLDPKKAHNGTIEYTSRDAHMGVPTMRGDFEILGYNMIQWLCGSLPWEKNLTDPALVQKQKEKAFENLSDFLNKCFNNSVPSPVYKYMTLLSSMKFNDTPNYDKFKQILIEGLKELNEKPDGKLEFKSTSAKQQVTPKSTPKRKKIAEPARSSPRTKKVKSLTSVRSNNLNDSNVGIVIDKKRGKTKDIRKILNEIDSEDEYDIKIVKKTKLEKEPNAKAANNVAKGKAPSRTRKRIQVKYYDESESDSEPEITPEKTKSRNANASKSKAPGRSKGKSANVIINETASEEDIFDA